MAGVVPLSGKTGRKQWVLHDGPRGSLRRLRSQLAEDGCPESQVVLAKQLLEERCELDVDKEENAKLGVYWLTKASEQGNQEATDILKQCLATGCGITRRNYYDVKSCLDMSQDEKLARKAAREMFASLSNGQDFVTTEQLGRKMRKITARRGTKYQEYEDNSERRFEEKSGEGNGNWSETAEESGASTRTTTLRRGKTRPYRRSSGSRSSSSDSSSSSGSYNRDGDGKIKREILEYGRRSRVTYPGEKITEAVLVSAASSYAHGLLPIVSQALCTVDRRADMRLEAIPLLQRPFVHPFESLKRLYGWIIDRVERRGSALGWMPSSIQPLALLLVYSLLGTESLVLFLPMALYYLSFLVMVVSSLRMLRSKRESSEFRVWSTLFLSYSGGNVNTDEAEYRFSRNNLRPYAHFFLALLANLLVYPVIAHQWTPQSELAIVAFAMTLGTLINFTWTNSQSRSRHSSPDLLALLSFGVHVLAKYPYETDMVVAQTWRFLDIRVPTFASYVVGNGIEFCLNFRAVFYLLIPGVFAKMAARDNWRGTYETLIPHCVTLSWWQMAILSSQGATWYGLIRGALALVGMVLFFPLASLASIVLPIVATAKYLSESELAMRLAVTALVGGTPFLGSWYLGRARSLRFNWIITLIQVCFGLAAGAFLSWPMIHEYGQENAAATAAGGTNARMATTLSWEQYQNYCHQPAWEETSSKAQVQVRCAQLEGASISWEGYVTNVRLKSITNNLARILYELPEFIRQPLSCLWGEPIENDCRVLEGLKRKTCESISINSNIRDTKEERGCHLFGWNRYEFEILVKMKSGMWGNNAEIVLLADHSFTNFSLNIYPGDKISFMGIVTNIGSEGESLLGGSRPHVRLDRINCLVCHTVELSSTTRQRYRFTLTSLSRALYLGAKLVLNFLFNPLVIFK